MVDVSVFLSLFLAGEWLSRSCKTGGLSYPFEQRLHAIVQPGPHPRTGDILDFDGGNTL
jgi:hypothetical protein